MAIMDCDSEIQNLYGDDQYVNVKLIAEFRADNDHFSYEEQGVL